MTQQTRASQGTLHAQYDPVHNVKVVCRKRLRYVVVTSRVLAQPVADKNNAFCGVFTRPRPKEPLARQFSRRRTHHNHLLFWR